MNRKKPKSGKGERRKAIKPVLAWAELSEDVPPSIWAVAHWRENLRQDLRHIRVRIVPLNPKRKAK